VTIRVIGAGLSGLATAWYLAEAGGAVHVTEAASGPGGLIQTRHVPEGMVEAAARGFTGSERVSQLFEAAGVSACPAREQSARRYIFRGRRPRKI
jgi:protoporphyrinogen oxidase